MEQAEHIELFRKYIAARAAAQVETNPDYYASGTIFMGSSGTQTVASSEEPENAQIAFWGEYPEATEIAAAAKFVLTSTHVAPAGTSAGSDMIFGEGFVEHIRQGYVARDITPVGLLHGPARISGKAPVTFLAKAGKGDGFTVVGLRLEDVNGGEGGKSGESGAHSDSLDHVVDQARRKGLKRVADRLAELGREPLDEDELPLEAASAKYFVEYCSRRGNHAHPLITATPTGNLDATWKGPEGQSVVMRFFPSGLVWVAYSLTLAKGSFEVAATDLLDPKMRFNIPDWA